MSIAASKIRGAILGAFVGDASSLGYHWIYDVTQIPQPPPLKLEAPRAKWHNPGLKPGSFTHYGEQNLVLLKSLSDKKYDLNTFWNNWKLYWKEGNEANALSYRDGATKGTLENAKNTDDPRSVGSSSHDLSGAVRVPLLLLAFDVTSQEDAFLKAVKEVVAMTHNSESVDASSQFIAKVLIQVLKGSKPSEALKKVSSESSDPFVKESVEKGFASVSQETTEAIKTLGQSCDAKNALPSAVHLLVKYEDNLVNALTYSVAAGGDSAARGAVVATILGAYHGEQAFPQDVLDSLLAYDTIKKIIN